MKAMAIAEFREARGRKAGVKPGIRESAQSYAAALVLALLFMGATLPPPLYVIYRDELHFSQVTLTLVYAIHFAGAMATAFLPRAHLGRARTARGDFRRGCDQHRRITSVHPRRLARNAVRRQIVERTCPPTRLRRLDC